MEGAVVKGARAVVVLVVGGVLMAGLVGCTSAAEEPPGLTASPTVSATPTPEPTEDTAVVEAAILDVYYRYWDAVVAAQAGNLDPSLFEGAAVGIIVEEAFQTARQYQESGFVREGEPQFSDVTVTVDGETAVVWACLDSSGWLVPGTPTEGIDLVNPGGLTLEQVDGAWLVTDAVAPPEEFTC